MSIEINDLDNVEQEVNHITDLSTNEIEVIHIDGVSNIPLIKGDVGEKGETGPANCLQIGIVEEGDEAFRTYANYSQFFAFENNREDTKENTNSNIYAYKTMSGKFYSYLPNTRVRVLQDLGYINYIEVIATKRRGYVYENVYK